MIGCNIANTIARGLNSVHIHICQICENIRNILQPYPVKLHILTGGKMPIAAVIALGNIGQLFHLHAAERPIGDSHPQHIGMKLQIQAILQPQGLKLLFAQNPVKAALNLGAPKFSAALTGF